MANAVSKRAENSMSPRVPGRWSCIRLAIFVLLAAVSSSCTRLRPPLPAAAVPPPPRDVEALIDRGCFRCLELALARAEERRQTPLAFEAAVLLALRAIELGMPSDEWIARARTYADASPERAQYLEMATGVPPDPLRGLRDDLLVETQIRNRIQQQLASVVSWYDVLQTGSHSDVFRRYLELTLICAVDRRPERFERLDALVPRLPDLPVLKYRVGVCDDRYQSQLRSLQQEVPEFVDADFALGRYALRNPTSSDPDEALRRFRSAAAAFPTSTAIPMAIGNVFQSWEDWANALTAFDQALALLPSHPDARLGRVISLSNLDRHDEAIASATELIDAGRWHLGQALYWRAWNYFNIGNNQAARADADRTRTLMVNPAVFLLSGLIEWRFLRRDSAETEFQEALKMDFGQCEAAFYLGGVRVELRKVPEAIAAMNQARQCYDLAITVRRKLFEDAMAKAATPAAKARESARHERAIALVEKRRVEVVDAIERLQTLQTAPGSTPTSRRSPQGR
jgi:tetratricopeptide (TPR) repeat protein